MEKKKNVKYLEGDLFQIQLSNNEKILGLIARKLNKMLLGYFWKFDFELNQGTVLNKNSIILITQFSGLGFEIGNWKLLGKYEKWQKSDWGFPEFRISRQSFDNNFRATTYNDTFDTISERIISSEEYNSFYEDGLHGYVSLENYLLKITS
jgi:hypothetical protein